MPDYSSMIGRPISHFRIIEKWGGCGMGLVYKAEDIDLGRFGRFRRKSASRLLER